MQAFQTNLFAYDQSWRARMKTETAAMQALGPAEEDFLAFQESIRQVI